MTAIILIVMVALFVTAVAIDFVIEYNKQRQLKNLKEFMETKFDSLISKVDDLNNRVEELNRKQEIRNGMDRLLKEMENKTDFEPAAFKKINL